MQPLCQYGRDTPFEITPLMEDYMGNGESNGSASAPHTGSGESHGSASAPHMDSGESHGSASAPINHNLEQLKLLFDYTKFHIGLYTTLAAALVATLGSNSAKNWEVNRWLIAAAVVCIAFAGVFGGIVAASLPALTKSDNLWGEKTGPYGIKRVEVRTWTYLEHSAFWLAIILVLVAFAPAVCNGAKKGSQSPTAVEVNGYESVRVNR
jgi:hypothetical protein